ncbi:MAG TPA: tetratricopeptide repeat protein [Rhizomicrobium sp.]|nr:tetratricopeptide repeat protein [Rhizomicrobium sp.]
MSRLASRTLLSAFLLGTTAGLLAGVPCDAQMGGGSYGGGQSSSQNMPPSHSSSSSGSGHVSKAAGPTIIDAQKALQAKDFQGAMAKLKEAQAIADRTDFDTYIINRMMMSAAVGLNDMATAATAAEAAAASPAMPDADRASVLHDALQLATVQKQYPQVIQYGQQLVAMNGLDYTTASMLAIAYYDSKDYPHAQQYAQQSIQLAKAAGQPPDQNALLIIEGSQANTHNEAGAEQTLEQMALQSPSPEIWGQLVGVAFGAKGMNDATAIYLYRLLMLADAAKGSEYKEMASALTTLGYPTEAVKIMQQGIASGKITQGEVGAMLAKARRDAAADERMLPQIASAAEKSRGGEQDIKLAEDYWGYGRYAEAETAARRAVGKGGLKTPAEGPLMIGAAEVAQGKYADAVQTLSQVSGNEAATRTAHLWSLYAQSKQGGRSAAAAPTAPAH